MSNIEYFNLNWLSKAFAENRKPGRRFYYDRQLAIFFYTADSDFHGTVDLYSTLDQEIGGDLYHDLLMRLDLEDEAKSGIIELPRLTEWEKKDIQIRFLSTYEGYRYYYEYYKSVMNQTDDEGFILDEVMAGDEAELLPSFWEQYKLTLIHGYIIKFARSINIELDLSI